MVEKSRLPIRVACLIIMVSLALSAPPAVAVASDPIDISDWHDLHAVRDGLSGHYRLMNDLDETAAGYTDLASSTANEGRGWQPIGTPAAPFVGSFDGQGHEIVGLFAHWPAEKGVGLFGYVGPEGTIEAVGIVNVSLAAESYVGSLVGWNQGAVSRSYSTGSVNGDISVGGLVGVSDQGSLSKSHSAATVVGVGGIGGLVGWSSGTVHNSYSTGHVSGDSIVGGVVGHNIGGAQGGIVSNSYFAGSLNGESRVGGVIGYNMGGVIANCYSAGILSAESDVGGVVGYNVGGAVANSFWDVLASGVLISAGGTGKTTAEMMRFVTFTDTNTEGLDQPWDMAAVDAGEIDAGHTWNIVEGAGPPFLSGKQLELYSLTVSSSEGGQVTRPGQGSFVYDAGAVVSLVAQPEQGYRFAGWSGDVATVANVDAAATTITVQGSYTIRASFEQALPARVNWPLIGGIVAAAAVAGLLVLFRSRSRPARTKKRRRA
jgi:hypothetical protein